MKAAGIVEHTVTSDTHDGAQVAENSCANAWAELPAVVHFSHVAEASCGDGHARSHSVQPRRKQQNSW